MFFFMIKNCSFSYFQSTHDHSIRAVPVYETVFKFQRIYFVLLHRLMTRQLTFALSKDVDFLNYAMSC